MNKGNFIDYLRKEDFDMFEKGKRQKIVDFYLKEIRGGKLWIKREWEEPVEESRTILILS